MAENFREFHPGNNPDDGRETQGQGRNRSFGRLADGIVILIVLAVLGRESVYSIGVQEQGVVTMFGLAGSVLIPIDD